MTRKFRTASLILLAIAGVLFAYWVKCQNAVDVIPFIKWESFLPLDSLQRKPPILKADQGPFLIQEDFNRGVISKWFRLWSRSKSAAVKISANGVQSSKCAVVESRLENENWAFQYDSPVEVTPGQEFEYEYWVRTQGTPRVRADIVLFSSNKNVVDWHHASGGPDFGAAEAGWVRVARSFFIPKDVKYIQFRIAGTGAGKIFLDNILMVKK